MGRGAAPVREITFVSLVASGPKVSDSALVMEGLQLLKSGRAVPNRYIVTHRNTEKAECFLEVVEMSNSRFKESPYRSYLTLWLNSSCSNFKVSGKRGRLLSLWLCFCSWSSLGRRRCDLSKSLGFPLVFIVGGHHDLIHKPYNTQCGGYNPPPKSCWY